MARKFTPPGPVPGEAGQDGADTTPARRLVLTRASDIKPKPVVWAWEDNGNGRIPAGSLALAAGREGTGKSSFAIWLAAQVTTGRLPGSLAGSPRAVIYVAVEDSWQHTLVPRLMAAGADLDRVYRAEVVTVEDETVSLSLPTDNKLLEAEIRLNGVALVVLDPLMSAISETLDTHVNRQVRQALDPLARLADRAGAVMLGIAHFSKAGGTDVSSLITGSGAFKDVARCIFGFAAEEESESAGVITQTKNSLGRSHLPSLAYHIVEAAIETDEGVAKTGRLIMDGETERSAMDILGEREGDAEERTANQDAKEFLRDALKDGPRRSREVEEEAREVHDIKLRTLKRARQELRIPARQRPSGSAQKGGKRRTEWWLSLPEHEGDLREPYEDPEDTQSANGPLLPKKPYSWHSGTLPSSGDDPGGTLPANDTMPGTLPIPGGGTPQSAKRPQSATLRVPSGNALTSQECQSAKSARPLRDGTEVRVIASSDPSLPNPMPDCRHPACVDALLGECLANRGICVLCGTRMDAELAKAGDLTHPGCAEDGGRAA